MEPFVRPVLEHVPGLATILVAMQLRVAAQAWGQCRHAIPGRTKEGLAHRLSMLWQPRPGGQSNPVHDLMRPNPDQRTTIDLNLAGSFHPRPQAIMRVVELRLDPEKVPAFFRRRHRRDL